jgi:hypothetical protein
MNAPSKTVRATSAVCFAETRVSQYDWETLSGDLNGYGCAVLEKLLSLDQCRQIAGLYQEEEHFRSHVHMGRHGFGKGEYRYFKYPLPDLLSGLRRALYPHLVGIANDWNVRMGIERRYPQRLQLPAPRPVRRPRVSASGRDPALRARTGLHRWRVRPYRAATAHAESGRSRATAPGRCGRIRCPQPARSRHQRNVPRQPPARRQPPAHGHASHGRDHLSRREVTATSAMGS